MIWFGQSAPIIHGLRTGLLPARRWALRSWFYASPLWFYHGPRLHQQLRSADRAEPIERLIDPSLRELCHLLHDAGIKTSPSCQGHFHAREHYQQVWEILRQQASTIRSRGLALRDSETGDQFLFREPDHELPWRNFDRFFGDVIRHQHGGFLSLVFPKTGAAAAEKMIHVLDGSRFVSIELDDELSWRAQRPIVTIAIRTHDPVEQRRQWRMLTAQFKTAMHRIPAINHR